MCASAAYQITLRLNIYTGADIVALARLRASAVWFSYPLLDRISIPVVPKAACSFMY